MVRRIFKALGVLTFFGISLVSLYLVNLFYMKPASIDHYLAKEVITDLVDSPEAMTYMGVFDGLNWLTNHNSKLSIPKSDDLKKDIQNARKRLNILNKYNDESLNSGQRITKKIAIFDTENNIQDKIKKHIKARRKSFRSRHKCEGATNKLSARYWSCKAW